MCVRKAFGRHFLRIACFELILEKITPKNDRQDMLITAEEVRTN